MWLGIPEIQWPQDATLLGGYDNTTDASYKASSPKLTVPGIAPFVREPPLPRLSFDWRESESHRGTQ